MTASDLSTRYLTIGTPMRLHERKAVKPDRDRIPLGEKGIGRLAAMRLGHYITVETGVSGTHDTNILQLDWRPVFANVDLDADALSFAPTVASNAKKLTDSGTTIRIQDLQSDWDTEKIRELSQSELAKLADPFKDNFANQFITVRYQEEKKTFISGFQSSLLKYADATCEIEFRAARTDDESPRLQVTTSYDHYSKAETVQYEGAHITNIVSYPLGRRNRTRASDPLPGADEVVNALRTLGDFSANSIGSTEDG
jgi:hypothetical protein